jgi:D-alanyl-D-alanine carboxypeptidase (penicillin-binding protein 5/6)
VTAGRHALALATALAALALPTAAESAAAAAPPVPTLRAQAAILVEPATGDVVLQRNARRPRAVASTTKLMTALLTLERARLSDVLSAVRYRALPAESIIGLRAGERLTVADLLRGLLLASANDAAATLAQRIGGSQRAFVALMNRRARELGLQETHYANPIGLDQAGNRSSAEDLVKLTLILRRNAFFRAVTDRPAATLRSGARVRTIANRNLLVRSVPAVNGVKTGHTRDAGYVLVGSATAHGVTVVSAVLGEPGEAARDADSLALLRYGLSRYAVASAVRRGRPYAQVGLTHRSERPELVAARDVRRVVRRGERFELREVGVPHEIDGPLPAGSQLGTLEVHWRGRVIARVPLVTREAIGGATVLQRADDLLAHTAVVVALAVVALASLQLVLLRRRAVRRRRRRPDPTGIA